MTQASSISPATRRAGLSIEAEAYLLGIVSVAAFALTLPCAKALAGHLSAVQIGLFRSVLAALAAVPQKSSREFTSLARTHEPTTKRTASLPWDGWKPG